ncbi:MAG: carboxypeptidase-like regulatory domain-containing protein, partial [Armatimonadota bacterium]
MATTQIVAVGVPRGTQFAARKLSDGLLKEGSVTTKVRYVKQSTPVEYYDGNSWVTSDPGPLSMTEDGTIAGVYEHIVTYDEAGVDYIVKCWDDADSDVQVLVGRARGVQPEEEDGVWRVHVTVKEADAQGDPIAGVLVSIKNSSSVEVSRAVTNSSGVANELAVVGAATYTVTMALAGYQFSDESLVVAGGDASPKTADYYG